MGFLPFVFVSAMNLLLLFVEGGFQALVVGQGGQAIENVMGHFELSNEIHSIGMKACNWCFHTFLFPSV